MQKIECREAQGEQRGECFFLVLWWGIVVPSPPRAWQEMLGDSGRMQAVKRCSGFWWRVGKWKMRFPNLSEVFLVMRSHKLPSSKNMEHKNSSIGFCVPCWERQHGRQLRSWQEAPELGDPFPRPDLFHMTFWYSQNLVAHCLSPLAEWQWASLNTTSPKHWDSGKVASWKPPMWLWSCNLASKSLLNNEHTETVDTTL